MLETDAGNQKWCIAVILIIWQREIAETEVDAVSQDKIAC